MPVFYFTGDSITASNRLWLPESNSLGNGYVSLLADRLKKRFPEPVFYNKGFDGFTAAALLRYLRQDTVLESADYITVQIGINNVGVAMNTGVSLEAQGFAQHYEQLLSALAGRSSDRSPAAPLRDHFPGDAPSGHSSSGRTPAQILAVGPFLFPWPQEYVRWIPAVYRAEAIMAKAAAKVGVPFLPLQDVLNDAARRQGYYAITTDGIHLTPTGHALLAELLLPYYPD